MPSDLPPSCEPKTAVSLDKDSVKQRKLKPAVPIHKKSSLLILKQKTNIMRTKHRMPQPRLPKEHLIVHKALNALPPNTGQKTTESSATKLFHLICCAYASSRQPAHWARTQPPKEISSQKCPSHKTTCLLSLKQKTHCVRT